MIFAVATIDTVYIYDTQQHQPIASLGNLHYATYTDLAWSSTGETLLLSSADGFCSVVQFEKNELGEEYVEVNDKNSSQSVEI